MSGTDTMACGTRAVSGQSLRFGLKLVEKHHRLELTGLGGGRFTRSANWAPPKLRERETPDGGSEARCHLMISRVRVALSTFTS